MYKASDSSSENWETMKEIIDDYNLSGYDVLNLLTDWHGLCLLDKSFMENLIDCEL